MLKYEFIVKKGAGRGGNGGKKDRINGKFKHDKKRNIFYRNFFLFFAYVLVFIHQRKTERSSPLIQAIGQIIASLDKDNTAPHYFVMDNASIHTSNFVKDLFKNLK